MEIFQSTLPRGERRWIRRNTTRKKVISIHAPARGATGNSLLQGGCYRNFNPRSREGSDTRSHAGPRNTAISIHAPARGATDVAWLLNNIAKISIHAPARGATTRKPIRNGSTKFQSTLPRGERPGGSSSWIRVDHDFNPRSREGSDIPIDAIIRWCVEFQSTLPRGERHPAELLFAQLHAISIHAPARGATSIIFFPFKNESDFNPRSREGSDYEGYSGSAGLSDFNPRSREGSDALLYYSIAKR